MGRLLCPQIKPEHNMSLQWQMAAVILYAEIFIVLLLSLPIIPSRYWSKILKSRIVSSLLDLSNHIFVVVSGIFTLMLFDSVRQMQKYERLALEYEKSNSGICLHDPQTQKFRAQRNFYITLFGFVFWFVIKRLTWLIFESDAFRNKVVQIKMAHRIEIGKLKEEHAENERQFLTKIMEIEESTQREQTAEIGSEIDE